MPVKTKYFLLLTKDKSKTKKVNNEGVDDTIKAAGHLSYDILTGSLMWLYRV